jgi:ERCC4-related helicase
VVSSSAALKDTLVAATSILKIEPAEIGIISGDFLAEERQKLFSDSKRKLFIASDQALQNDMIGNAVRPDHFSLAVFQDAHEARGSHPFANLATRLKSVGAPVVGLTSAPPVNPKEFQKLLESLDVNRSSFYKLSPPHQPVSQKIFEVALDDKSCEALASLRNGVTKAARKMQEILGNSYKFGYSPERQEITLKLRTLMQEIGGNLRVPSQSEIAEFRLRVSQIAASKKIGGWRKIFSLTCEISELVELHHCIASHGRHSFLQRSARQMWEKESGASSAENKSSNYLSRIFAPAGAAREAYRILSIGTGNYERLLSTNIAQLKSSVTQQRFFEIANEDLFNSAIFLHEKERVLFSAIGNMIARDPKGKLLIFVDRQEDAQALAVRISSLMGYEAEPLTAGKRKDKNEILNRFNAGRTKLLIATSAFAGEDLEAVSNVIAYCPPHSTLTDLIYKIANKNGSHCKVTYLATSGTSEVKLARKAKAVISEFEHSRFTQV